jgi:hypothetical protein
VSAAAAYRTAAPVAIERLVVRRFPLLAFVAISASWILLTGALAFAFVREAPAVDVRCDRDTTVRCTVTRFYPVVGAFPSSLDDVRAIERETEKGQVRLVFVSPGARLPMSERFSSEDVRTLQQMRLERFLGDGERSLALPYDDANLWALALVVGPLALLPLLLLMLERTRLVLRDDALSLTRVVAGVLPKTRVVPRNRIVATRIDEREAGPGNLRYRVMIALDTGESVSVLPRETSDLERSEECLAWLRARVGAPSS